MTVLPAERRALADRRRRPTPMLSRYWLRGRRRGARRLSEAHNVYVDRYRPREWAMVGALFALVAADTVLTLRHVEGGGAEWNPLMALLFDAGGGALFAGAKLGGTALALLFLLLHVRFRWVPGLLAACLLVYALLMGWHALVAS